MRSKRRVLIALCGILAITAGACGDDDGNTSGSASGPTASSAGPTTTATPVRGGSITIGIVSEVPGLDPVAMNSSGSAGGIEGAALYDTVMRFNPDTKKYEGRTAASLDANAEFTQWTLKLKPDIRFGDGTAYDAEAVKFNLERHTAATSRSGSRALLSEFVQSIDVVDPLTVRFTLKKGWPSFPFVLTQNAGMIASPAAIKAAGAEFATKPGKAGAGPFELVSFTPKESIVMRRNPTFYGGEVYLDQITFVPPTTGGDSAKLDSLGTNTLQVALLSGDPVTVAKAAEKYPVITRYSFAGSIIAMNVGVEVTCRSGKPATHCADKPDGTKVKTQPPTADLRVRKAVQAAIDIRVVNERAWGGKGLVHSSLLPKEFPWDPGVAGPTYNLAEAKRLVDEAKRGGWNGSLRLLAPSDSLNSTVAIAVQTMLEAAGIQVSLTQKDVTAFVSQVQVEQDFELVVPWSYSISDDDGAFASIYRSLNSPGLAFGYANPEMDAAIDAVRVARSDDEKRAGYKRVSEIFNRDAPAVVLQSRKFAFAHSPRLHGFQQSATAIVFLDKAWQAAS